MQPRGTWRARFGRRVATAMRGLLFAFAGIVVPGLAVAQATITGRITDQGSQQPIQDARVLVLGTSLVVLSGQDGRYTLRNVPVGTAEVQVIRVGFQPAKRSVRTIDGQTATLDITMNVTVVQLQEVVTTATGQQRRVELGNAVTNLDAT